MRTSFRTILFATALLAAFSLQGQEMKKLTFSIDDVVSIARDNANQAVQAKHSLESELSDFSAFLASRKWQLDLTLNPSYRMMAVSLEDYSLSGFAQSNTLSTGASLDFSKLVQGSGGYLYASSSFGWDEFFSDARDGYIQQYGAPRLFNITPLRVGYRQELMGYNGPSWEKRIRETQADNARKDYVSEMAAISETAAGYFFSYATSKAMYDMYRVNAESADSLYRIGVKKYELTSIRKDELLSLQLQLMNSQNDVRASFNSMEKARRSLLSYLEMGYEDVSVDVILPENPERLILVDPQEAIEIARTFNPEFGKVQEASLRAEQEFDKARREKGIRVDLDLSAGIQQYGYSAGPVGLTSQPYAIANVTLAFPLVDHGMRRDNYNAAKSRVDYYNVQKSETERTITEAIVNTINELQIQQEMLADTKKAMDLADESFDQNQYNYAQGLSDINTFTLAQNRKDSAHINYITSLSNFWLAYYRLCSITLYDFYNMKPLN